MPDEKGGQPMISQPDREQIISCSPGVRRFSTARRPDAGRLLLDLVAVLTTGVALASRRRLSGHTSEC